MLWIWPLIRQIGQGRTKETVRVSRVDMAAEARTCLACVRTVRRTVWPKHREGVEGDEVREG